MLPHESETNFRTLLKELSHEFASHQFGFGRYIAHEAAISRVNIERLRQALLANAGPKLAIATCDEILVSSELEWRLERLLDRETSRFEKKLALVDKVRRANQGLFAMEQQLNLVTATTPNPTWRPLAEKVSPSERRRDELERERFQRRKYIDPKNNLTEHAKAILGRPPLVIGEPEWPYYSLLFAVMDCCGFEKISDVLSACDIANDTWQVRRLLCAREQAISIIYRAELIGNYRDSICTTSWKGKPLTELHSLTSPLFQTGVLDSTLILLATLRRCLDVFDSQDRQMESVLSRRDRTLEKVIKRGASRLRTLITQARGFKSQSTAEWRLLKWQV
jgi:hypothetical protein